MAHDPARDSSLEVLGKVAELAAQIGLVGRLEEDTRRFFLGVDLGQGVLELLQPFGENGGHRAGIDRSAFGFIQ